MTGERLRRAWGAVGLAGVRLRRNPRRTALAVVGVGLAVLAVTLFASVGLGVAATGEEKFDSSGRDLWVTGGPLEIRAREAAPLENSLLGAHEVAAGVGSHEDVAVATPMAFQAIYVGANASDLRLITAVGVPKAPAGTAVSVDSGEGLERGDVHYANGSYDGPMTRNVLLDPGTAERLGVSVGDTVHVGASRAGAREREFTVVGISSTFSNFLGTETAVLHLSELQALTGTTGADRASLLTVRLEEGADPEAVRADLQATYPDLEVRTNREQLTAVLGRQAPVVGSAATLVALSVALGLALALNLLLLTVTQQRRERAALQAIGLSPRTLSLTVETQGLLVGLGGATLGVLATPVAAAGLDRAVAAVVGFESLLRTPPEVYLLGAAVAVGVGTLSGLVAGWYAGRTATLPELRG